MNNSFWSPKVIFFLVDRSRFVIKVFFCLALFCQLTAAQYRFDSFTTDNGLPQNGVRGLAQTPDGYLWFTTFDGLVRFDGVSFTVFDKNNSPGISSNRFAHLHVEPDGTLFAGTEESGLTVYRDGAFKTYTTADGLPSNTIVGFTTDIKGEFAIQTIAGYCYFRDGGFVSVPKADIPNNNLFYYSPTGNLWLYDTNSVRQITPDKREITYPIKIDYYNAGLSGITLFEDSRGNVWFGDLSAVYRLKDGNITRFTTADGVPRRTLLRPSAEDADGSIWFASSWFGDTEKVGLVRFHDGRFTSWGESAGLSNLSVGKLFKDREDTIWAATNGGLNHLQKQFIKSYSIPDGLAGSEVYPLLQTRNGDVYVGTTVGLSVYRDGKFSVVPLADGKTDVFITALFEDERGALWIGTAGGLLHLENKLVRKIDAFNGTDVWSIVKTTEGEFWVGTNKGLFRFKDENSVRRLTTADGLPGDDVKIIYQARAGAMWFGTYGGLAKMSESGTGFTIIEGLASPRVRAIYEDADGVLWIGTYDGGLSRLKDGRIFNYTVEQGLFNNGVFHIIEDRRGNFWISSNRGIYRVPKSELNDLADGQIQKINSVAYGKPDGMLNTECNGGRQPAGIKAFDGKLWFPTQNGVVVLDPEDVSLNLQPPPVEIETVLIERRTTDFRDGIALGAGGDNLEIRYTGISFIKPEQVKFRYRIEGLDENWTDVGTIRDVYFPSLPAGEYTFHVVAANSDGVWNMEGAHLKIRVLAPFWQKAWFYVLCSILAVTLIFLIFRLRERELKRRQLIQQEFSRRLIDSQEDERKRIAYELHDSIGQYLLAIKNWALFGLNSVGGENPAREFLNEVSDTSSLALVEVREMTHNLRPYQLERLGLTSTLEYMMKNIKNPSSIDFSSEIENVDGILSKEAEIVFYRIAQEAVNNVIKHSRAANAFFSVRATAYGMEFVCRDDGTGFDVEAAKSSAKSGLGLNGIAERVKILKGEYEISSEPGRSTIVSIRIPRNR